MDWISVHDRLPQNDNTHIVTDGRIVKAAVIDTDNNWWTMNGDKVTLEKEMDILFWTTLPPPKRISR